jgi:hypothetical protein
MLSPSQAKLKLQAGGFRPIGELREPGVEVQFLLEDGDHVWGCLLPAERPGERRYYVRRGRKSAVLPRAPLGFRHDAAAGYRREVA